MTISPLYHTIEVDRVEHWFWHVKNFMKQPHLLDFLPDDNHVSMAWVRLEEGEKLEPHIHPMESMILMCEGGLHDRRCRSGHNRWKCHLGTTGSIARF